MKRLKILLISGWYPTREKPLLGNFVIKHAESVVPFHDIYGLHITIDGGQKKSKEVEFQNSPFPSKVIYLRPVKILFLGKLIDRLRITLLYLAEFRNLQRNGFDPGLVHLNILLPLGIIAFIYKKFFGLPFVLSEHWTGYHPYAVPNLTSFQKWIIKNLGNHAEVIMPVSNDLGKAMQKYGIRKPFAAVANVANVKLFNPGHLNRTEDDIRMIHISTLDDVQKNINLLLTGFSRARNTIPNLKLHVITDGNWEAYNELVSKLNLREHIVNHGRKDEAGVASILKNCDFFVLTSNFENLPCVLIESISCGVPVIATNVGGVSEIVNNENGLLIPPRDTDALAKAMETMALTYKNYNKEEMHQEASQKYSYEAVGKQLSGIYIKYGYKKAASHA